MNAAIVSLSWRSFHQALLQRLRDTWASAGGAAAFAAVAVAAIRPP